MQVDPEGPAETSSTAERATPASPPRRRFRWLRRLFMLLVLVAIGAGVAWGGWLIQKSYFPRYTATAVLRIRCQSRVLLYPTRRGPAEFALYKATQAELIRSNFVLLAALRRLNTPETDSLGWDATAAAAATEVIRQQPDAVRWLRDRLRVDFPGGGELMRIRLTAREPNAAAALVNAVVESYMDEIVAAEQSEQRRHLDELDRAYSMKDNELRAAKASLNSLRALLGSEDSPAARMQHEFQLEQLQSPRRWFLELRAQRLSAEMDLTLAKAEFKAVQESASAKGDIPQEELDRARAQDSVASQLEIELIGRKARRSALAAESAPATEGELRRLDREIETIEQELAGRSERAARKARTARVADLADRICQTEARRESLADQSHKVERELMEGLTDIRQTGPCCSIDVEIQEVEVAQIEKILEQLREERERLRVELGFEVRNVAVLTLATPPTTPD